MESRSLKTIQTLAKIGKVLSKLVFIFCVIGTLGCGVGVATLAGVEHMGKDGTEILEKIKENSDGMSTETMYAEMIVGFVVCAAEMLLAAKAKDYFEHELEEGTPFKLKLADELKSLGLWNIVLSLGVGIVCRTGWLIAEQNFPALEKMTESDGMKRGDFGSVGLGITMLIFALLCRYGAELTGDKNDPEE